MSPPASSPTRAPSRIVIEDVAPVVAGGRFPLKRVVGEPVTVRATVFADGHDELAVVVTHRSPRQRTGDDHAMWSTNPGLDQWETTFTPLAEGMHTYKVLAWIDHFASWQQATRRKLDAGVDIDSDLLVGAQLLEDAADTVPARDREPYLDAAARLKAGQTLDVSDPGGEDRPSAAELYRRSLRRADATAGPTIEVLVERERALFNAWYELFPRSWSTDPKKRPHGTLNDVAAQLDYVADAGFDVLYLPPVSPIGLAFRKGPDNSETAEPGDPGSPWAIGSPDGGHDAVHPDLGTLDDVRNLVLAAQGRELEVALDLAFQCSPDHPWVAEHPEWFLHRPDGTIQYAENPPKRYQDIYPLDFDCTEWRALWQALLEVARVWLDVGVTIFRIDNPHTKPFPFWEWFIAEIRATHPDTLFLAEAFTRPRPMHRLGELGFTLSYSYFPWRVSKGELTEYFSELASEPSVDHLRPSAWPNTPDILSEHMWDAPATQNAARLFLAATLCPSYGIYGPAFELADNQPANNGKEEYGRSEKYEIRQWDLDDPNSLIGLVAEINAARYDQLALHTLRTLHFHAVDDDHLLAYSKTPHGGADADPDQPPRNAVLCIANLDPIGGHAATVHLDLWALGIDPARDYEVHDLLTGCTFVWSGADNYVELHPESQPGHLFRVSQSPR